MDMVDILNLIAIILFLIIAVLAVVYLFMTKKKTEKEVNLSEKDKKSEYSNSIENGLTKESIHKFMEFDEIKDNMIIRKNREQYVMVIQCQGVNYDLMSEQEKIAVEEGFVQFLNTLRFPIQLYVQTRSLNLKDIISEYKERVKVIENEVEQIRAKIKLAEEKGNRQLVENLKFQERRKVNVLEYGSDISEYIARLSLNKNVLQQKTYVVVSYFVSEYGNVSNYSKEEIDNICFSELYTRSQSVLRSLATAEVTGKMLSSEELAELLYVAYNRDDSELVQLSKALDAEYDNLYHTGRDILKKKEALLDEQLEIEAIELTTDSIIIADKKIQEEKVKAKKKVKRVKEKSLNILDEYKEQMEDELFERAQKEIIEESKRREMQIDEELEKTEVEPGKKRGRPSKKIS